MVSKKIVETTQNMEDGNVQPASNTKVGFCSSPLVVVIGQKLIAEVIGTYFVIFAGCESVVVNKLYGGSVTFPGICVTWGLIVMVMAYTVGRTFVHNSSTNGLGSILASGTLALMLDVTSEAYFGTVPTGSNGQSLAVEIIISFLLIFVISDVGTDDRAIGHLAGIAVGMTITLNVFVAGSINESSKKHRFYRGLWVYIIGPIIGILAGAFAYNLIRSTDKPLSELTKSVSSLQS